MSEEIVKVEGESTKTISDLSSQLDNILLSNQTNEILLYKTLEKAFQSDDPALIMKASNIYKKLENIEEKVEDNDRKSYLLDPFDFHSQFGYKDKSFNLSYNLLYKMSKTPIINSIIKTRVSQIASFCEPQRDKYGKGFKIQKKTSFRDKKITKEEQKTADKLQSFLLNCGEGYDWEADDFDAFVRKIVRDSLIYDQMTFEVIRNKKGRVVQFIATDAATFRIAESIDINKVPNGKQNGYYPTVLNYEHGVKHLGYNPSYVQIYQGQAVNDFYPWELCFGVRNPDSNIYSYGYGVSELEDLVTTVTSMLWSDEYNRRFFTTGSAPKGIIKIKGSIPDARLKEFKQAWTSMIAGVYNSWKTPIMNADEMEWIDLQKNNRDMEYNRWQEYLIKLCCAVYQIDPSEIGFPLSGNAEGNNNMFAPDGEQKTEHSKDKGLYPLLKFLQAKINKYIIGPLNPDYEFVFCGLDGMTYEKELDLATRRLSNFTTLDEERANFGLNALPDKKGDLVLNPTYMQNVQLQSTQQQQPPPGEEGGGDEEQVNEGEQVDNNQEQESFTQGEENQSTTQGEDENNEKESQENPFLKSFLNYFKK